MQNIEQTQYGSFRKNNSVVFSSIQIHPIIYFYHISMATYIILLLHWKPHCGLEYNTNIVSVFPSSPHQVHHKTKRSQCGLECSVSIWFTCEHLSALKTQSCITNTVCVAVSKCLFLCHLSMFSCTVLCFRLLKSAQYLLYYISSHSVGVQNV